MSAALIELSEKLYKLQTVCVHICAQKINR